MISAIVLNNNLIYIIIVKQKNPKKGKKLRLKSPNESKRLYEKWLEGIINLDIMEGLGINQPFWTKSNEKYRFTIRMT